MLTPDDYTEDETALNHPLTRTLMQRIDFQHGGPDYDDKYPDGIPTQIQIHHTVHGACSSGLVMYPEGHARCQSDHFHELLQEKFMALATLGVDDPAALRVRFSDFTKKSPKEIATLYDFEIRFPRTSITHYAIATRLATMSLFGIFNVNKPPGWTSRRAVNHIQRFVRPAKVGHAGTLDPLATGVLLICVGPATRLVEYCHRLPKCYRATFLLGRQSPTDDTEVESEYLPDAPKPTRAQIEAALFQFQGEIEQRPPLFSAVKIQGQRAYKIARKGKQVELPMRVVTIHTIDLITYTYPELVLDIKCGTGTYIRALGRDLAFSLNTAAVMSALERTAIGNFQIEDSSRFDCSLCGQRFDGNQAPT